MRTAARQMLGDCIVANEQFENGLSTNTIVLLICKCHANDKAMMLKQTWQEDVPSRNCPCACVSIFFYKCCLYCVYKYMAGRHVPYIRTNSSYIHPYIFHELNLGPMYFYNFYKIKLLP